MAVWSIIKKSELEGASRTDSEYYQPEYLFNENIINRIENDNIGNISLNILYGTTPSGGEFVRNSKDSVPFIRSQNFNLLSIDADGVVYCDKNHHIKNKKSTIYPQDILFAAVGATIGQLAIVQNEIREGNINQNIARIRIKDKKFSSSYVAFFFYSKYGQKQINRYITGNAQFYLNSTQIASFRIPVLKDIELFDDYLNKIQDLIFQSKSLYSQAEQILLEELGLRDLDLQDDLFYTTALKEVKDNNRMDTYFFMPKFDIGLSKLKGKYKLKSVLELSRDVTTGQYCNEYIDKKTGIPYIRGTDTSNATINEDNLMYVDNPKNNGSKKAKEGDVVTTRVGTIGLVARIPRELEGCIISDNLIRIRLPKKSEISSYYLTMYLNSPFGKDLMISYSRGSVQQRLNQETLKEIPIPIVSNSLQVKIERLLVESWEKRKKAKQLLEQAKHKVEEMIEKEAEVK